MQKVRFLSNVYNTTFNAQNSSLTQVWWLIIKPCLLFHHSYPFFKPLAWSLFTVRPYIYVCYSQSRKLVNMGKKVGCATTVLKGYCPQKERPT